MRNQLCIIEGAGQERFGPLTTSADTLPASRIFCAWNTSAK